MKEISLLFLGWLLGILSPVIQEKILQKRNTKKIKASIINELSDLEYRLMFLAFGLFSYMGKMNREILTWAASVEGNYSGPFVNEKTKNVIRNLTARSDEEIAGFFVDQSQTIGQRIGKVFIPYTQSKLDSLSHFPTNFQREMYSIITQLSYLNEDINYAMEDYYKMFEPEISRENWLILRDNTMDRYQAIGNRSKQIAEKIKKIRMMNSN
jgi:hypothetical protein